MIGAPEEIRTPDPQIRSLYQVFDFARSCWKLASAQRLTQCTASGLRGGDRPSGGYRCVPVARRRSQYWSPTKPGIRSSEYSKGDQSEASQPRLGRRPRSIIAWRSSLSRCGAVAVVADAARRESNS
jgi:hypothetical protein